MSVTEILLIVGGVGYVLTRRLIGELVEIKGLLTIPIVLTIIGVCQLRHLGAVDATAITFVAIGFALSIGLGVLRGRTVHLAPRDGQLWMRYRASSIGLWLVNIALKVAFVPFEQAISGSATDAANRTMLLAIGLGILAETAVVLLRAMRSDATVVWEKGEDGEPHRTSPAFEQARAWLSGPAAGRPVEAAKRFVSAKRDW